MSDLRVHLEDPASQLANRAEAGNKELYGLFSVLFDKVNIARIVIKYFLNTTWST